MRAFDNVRNLPLRDLRYGPEQLGSNSYLRRKYLVFAPNSLSLLNDGFGFKAVKPGRYR